MIQLFVTLAIIRFVVTLTLLEADNLHAYLYRKILHHFQRRFLAIFRVLVCMNADESITNLVLFHRGPEALPLRMITSYKNDQSLVKIRKRFVPDRFDTAAIVVLLLCEIVS